MMMMTNHQDYMITSSVSVYHLYGSTPRFIFILKSKRFDDTRLEFRVQSIKIVSLCHTKHVRLIKIKEVIHLIQKSVRISPRTFAMKTSFAVDESFCFCMGFKIISSLFCSVRGMWFHRLVMS